MEIKKTVNETTVVITVTGRVDTTTAPELEAGLKLAGNETVTLDLSGVPYMSSAGLRCLLTAQKSLMAGGGSLTLTGLQPTVKEVLELTGFDSILTIV